MQSCQSASSLHLFAIIHSEIAAWNYNQQLTHMALRILLFTLTRCRCKKLVRVRVDAIILFLWHIEYNIDLSSCQKVRLGTPDTTPTPLCGAICLCHPNPKIPGWSQPFWVRLTVGWDA